MGKKVDIFADIFGGTADKAKKRRDEMKKKLDKATKKKKKKGS